MSSHIPIYEDDSGNTTDEPPAGFPDTTSIDEIDCSSVLLHELNDYIKNASDAANNILTLMLPKVNEIISDNALSATYLVSAHQEKTDFIADVVSINESYSTAIDSILTNEIAAMDDTVAAATLITSALADISIDATTEEALSLLLIQAHADLAIAEAHLALTLSHKDNVYAEIDDIITDATISASTYQAECDSLSSIAQTRKEEAEVDELYLIARNLEIEVLFSAADGVPYYTAVDSDMCFIGTPTTQSLSVQLEASNEYITDANNYINFVTGV
jgi:hypothetical protein